jgi:Na+:H+ antiporter, NhaA family
MKTTKLFESFFKNEKSSAIVLLFCTLFSIVVANSYFQYTYVSIWTQTIFGFPILHYINDGLMTIFFLMIGLELEREIYIGELSNVKNALLPISGAIGGMLLPAMLYLLLNFNTQYQDGIGIPMATDIAFAIGFLSLLGNKVPTSLKIFLTALAVIDDLGAIIVIALFYSEQLNWNYLLLSMGIFGILLALNRLKVYKLYPYIIGGVLMWYCMSHSGVHATITGVILAFAIPFQKGEEYSMSYRLQRFLHNPVGFIILPIFALANTAIIINLSNTESLFEPYAIGIIAGLMVGKPLGITLSSYLAVKLKFAKLPVDLSWKHIVGAGILGGIGFTMSIFITLLSFNDNSIVNNSKLFIVVTSLLSGIIGLLFLKKLHKNNVPIDEVIDP